MVDRYLSDARREFDALRRQARRDRPALYGKLEEARKRAAASSA
jgi:hypothetical protein